MTEKLYHIYIKKDCVYHNLNEEEFTQTWDMIQKFLSIHHSQINKDDVQYEEVLLDKTLIYAHASY
jgi:hypothetical protein